MSLKWDFAGKRVLVTEGTLATAAAAAQAFHDLGATVAVNARTAAQVDQLIQALGGGPRLIGAPGDITTSSGRRQAVQSALDGLGGLDVLVNCPDRVEVARVDDIEESHWQQMLDTNVKAVFFVTQACLPALKASKGSIVNVASSVGLVAGPAGTGAYSAAKGAVVQMTRMLALHLAHEGVRANVVCPGWIDAGKSALSAMGDSTPVGRAGTADECAGAILYLAAPFSGFTTGSVLTADGGFSAGR